MNSFEYKEPSSYLQYGQWYLHPDQDISLRPSPFSYDTTGPGQWKNLSQSMRVEQDLPPPFGSPILFPSTAREEYSNFSKIYKVEAIHQVPCSYVRRHLFDAI
jgi:hypothetical protein